ncbi:MAG: hypothetical protein O9340_15520 [Cyclobacteriaceae bacterium]|jgi:glutaredoxin-related protein|nr:hypothetical protein [Cyclobacteriaceae bacterium]
MTSKAFYFAIVAFFVLIIVIVLVIENSRSAQCLRQDDALNESFVGIIDKVYLDSNHHNFETIEINESGKLYKSYILLFDKSGCFSHLRKGDSVVKISKSLDLEIFRNDVQLRFKLDYDCNE